MKVIKRNGKEVDFNLKKIVRAITAARDEVKSETTDEQIKDMSGVIEKICDKLGREVAVEEIQDLVEEVLMKNDYRVAKAYVRYRYDREKVRAGNQTDSRMLTLVENDNEDIKQENSNKNPTIIPTQRDYMAGEVSKDLSRRLLLPKDVVKANDEGLIHFHDMDYFAQHSHNCDLVNLEDMLQNGTVISGTMIEKPHKFSTACNIATQIIAQVASSQYGGQSISIAHLVPFVEESRKSLRREVVADINKVGIVLTDKQIDAITEERVKKDIEKGVQTIQYQVVTLMTTNGQAPFITVYMYIDEVPECMRDDAVMVIKEILNQRIEGVKNEKGVFITPAFPKLIYVLDEDNIYEDSKYWDVTLLAAKCTAKRMVPDYISAKKMLEYKVDKNGEGHVYTCMGCRSFLTPYVDENGKPKYYGRFNQGVVSINLPFVALLAREKVDKSGVKFSNRDDYQARLEEVFWSILEDKLELCYRALMCRHKRLEGTVSDVAPILWQYGAIARLKKGEKIDKLLHGGYSTISLGYAGLYECTQAIRGCSHTTEYGKPFALDVMKKLNAKCAEWKAKENVDFSVYGTPLESATYKFAKALQKRFGIVKNVSDRSYVTNSYHVHVTEPIDAFSKLEFESEFQRLSPGGAISYVEVPNLTNNIDAVLAVMKYIYQHIMYAELNTKSDYCQVCGYDGEIQIVEDGNKLVWECPNCHNRDQSKMNVARRTCGYIGSHFWNQGRTQEIRDRVLHL